MSGEWQFCDYDFGGSDFPTEPEPKVKVCVETEPGIYEKREVSYEERRKLILATEPGRRFMTSDGTTLLMLPVDPRTLDDFLDDPFMDGH